MADCVELSKKLGKRVGEELGIPVFLYAEAAQKEDRRRLPDIREGEYEAMEEKLKDPGFKRMLIYILQCWVVFFPG